MPNACKTIIFKCLKTAILGYHGDKIILYKNVKNIKHVKNHRLFNYQICQDVKITDYLTIKYVNITDNSTITFGWNNFQNFGLQCFLHLFLTFI